MCFTFYLFTYLFIPTSIACNNQGFITYKAIHLDYLPVYWIIVATFFQSEKQYTFSDKAKAPEGALRLTIEIVRGIINNSLLPSPLFVVYIHRHFKAKTHFSSCWFSPHVHIPLKSIHTVCMCIHSALFWTYSHT